MLIIYLWMAIAGGLDPVFNRDKATVVQVINPLNRPLLKYKK